ncbi:Hypothetical_protein [Hexamita inflata]|uniref:Hypothetical_protein n=1 Tax=Hexamita inflata TaxID=28002 RepID=A0AA86QRC6_9EUKA|nr:Hypothetical protein HINF_LOCUS50825 [Hexamita inflata]
MPRQTWPPQAFRYLTAWFAGALFSPTTFPAVFGFPFLDLSVIRVKGGFPSSRCPYFARQLQERFQKFQLYILAHIQLLYTQFSKIIHHLGPFFPQQAFLYQMLVRVRGKVLVRPSTDPRRRDVLTGITKPAILVQLVEEVSSVSASTSIHKTREVWKGSRRCHPLLSSSTLITAHVRLLLPRTSSMLSRDKARPCMVSESE